MLGWAAAGVLFRRVRGEILDRRFRLDEPIAEGGFGTVYRALDTARGAEVAVKVLHPHLASDGAIVARFRREVNALATLRDPHTVSALAVGETREGAPYLVMELLEGANLHDVLRARGPLPWQRVVQIARGVCSSLREAHARRIIHRDLKPSNIHLETREGRPDFVKVLDFGIAKLIDAPVGDIEQLTLAGQMVGTVDYMSPEQLTGGVITARSDIFALGVVIYESLCGRLPFPDRFSLTAVADPPSEWCPAPPMLDLIVLRCLAADPKDRFHDVDELVRALDRVERDRAIPSMRRWPSGTPQPAWQRASTEEPTLFRPSPAPAPPEIDRITGDEPTIPAPPPRVDRYSASPSGDAARLGAEAFDRASLPTVRIDVPPIPEPAPMLLISLPPPPEQPVRVHDGLVFWIVLTSVCIAGFVAAVIASC